ncbi:GIY-YIG nuclease family protein [Streptomyces anulatus]|uniref:GIY-YIG nuclease family protein n=1 Tax=Streptomyces anulatus TaxID=1892 RepID=UPI002E14DCC1|nr:GIY-YIG nuclease family protein [Streptomyces anulatus]
MPTHETGFVYVMRNAAMQDLVKIGFTTKLPEQRAHELSKPTGVPLPFGVSFRALTMRWREVERLVHQRLGDRRISRKEFFAVSVDEAVETVRECVLAVDGMGAWEPDRRHLVKRNDRVSLSLEAGQIFVLLAMPSLFSGRGWEVLDLWQAHSDGDQLEIYGAGQPVEVEGFSDGDPGGDDDPVPHLDRSQNVANGALNGRERLAPGHRLLWLADADDDTGACTSVIFEAWDHCQVASRTWSPQWTSEGYPLILNALTRDPSEAMLRAARAALDLPAPRNWAPRPPANPVGMYPPPSPGHWLPQLRAGRTRRRRTAT